MRNRKLSRQEALKEYLIYQIRLFEYLHMFQIAIEIKDGKYTPQNPMGHNPNDFFGTVRTPSFGLFASLMDPQNNALDVFDVWRVLFPEKEGRIIETWERIKPHLQLIRGYRNNVAFHANKDLRRYFDTRRRFREKGQEIVAVMQEFWDLAAELIKHQRAALPDFRTEMGPILRTALPDLSPEQLEKLKDYFIQNEPSLDAGKNEKAVR